MSFVIIDPGHGGRDPGAVSDSLKEKDLNLKIAVELGLLLKQTGIETAFTRSDDSFKSLQERCFLANDLSGKAFISIHCNASKEASAKGIEVFFHSKSDSGKELAECIYQELFKLGRNGRGVKSDDFYVLKHTRMPACLVECGFITNAEEADWLKTHFKEIAQAISEGINIFLSKAF